MHRMNANRVTTGGTSALNDESIIRIEDSVKQSKSRRANKKQASMNKTASKNTANKKTTKSNNAENTTTRIIVASLNDIPSQFERIGTGFFREGHHLWEMAPGKGGYVLTRKHGEDHVLGYDPEPMKKESSVFVTDRFGHELKMGNKVRFPMRGKVATGTIIILTPGSMDVGLDNGDTASCPPGMAEFADENIEEAENHDGDKDAGEVFEPDINEKSTSDYVGPQSAQTGGIGGVAADTDEIQPTARKAAQTDQGTQTVTQIPESPTTEPSFPTYEYDGVDSAIATRLNNMGDDSAISMFSEDQNKPYYARKLGEDQYEVYMAETKMEKFPDISTVEDLVRFEENVGRLTFTSDRRIASIFEAAINTMESNKIDLSNWNEYWKSVGVRVAQASPTIPKQKLTDEEKKQKRKERRKQREVERSALPKGTKLPPKLSAKDTDEIAKLKEVIKILDSGYDELEYSIDSIDPEDPNADAIAADAITQTLERVREERREIEEGEKEEMDDALSLDMPSSLELGEQEKTSNKTTVSMSDL